jgi:hypothetical protein
MRNISGGGKSGGRHPKPRHFDWSLEHSAPDPGLSLFPLIGPTTNPWISGRECPPRISLDSVTCGVEESVPLTSVMKKKVATDDRLDFTERDSRPAASTFNMAAEN